MSVLSGYEQALWDILGKSLNAPVWRLLGGKARDRVPVYGNGWRRNAETIEEFRMYAKMAADEGWLALKWDPFGFADKTLTGKDMLEAEQQVAAVREAVGPDVQLLIEGHGRFNVATAIEVAKMLEPYHPHYFEEPVISDDIVGLAEVRKKSNIRIAAGERIHTLRGYKDLFVVGAVDIVQPDLIHAGGILNIRKIAALAESFGVSIAPHNCNGPICTAATLNVDMTFPNLDLQETMLADAPWRQIITDEKLVLEDGFYIRPSNRPGLGIELFEDQLDQYPAKDIEGFIFAPEFYRKKSVQRNSIIEQKS